MGRKGAYRGVEYSPEPFHVIDTAYYLVPKSEMDIRWLYYAVKHHRLGEIDDGSPIPSTTRSAVYIRDLDVPPLVDQRRIAEILGALDDKIELNRRMNETLEGMARALFKSWFVDFDPVRAKLDGRQPPGLDPATAALFPDSFQDSPLGLIPKGWKAASVSECCLRIQNGGTPRREERLNWEGGSIPWLTSGEVRDPIVIGTSQFITELGLQNSSAKWIPQYSTVVALYGATAGQVSLVALPVTTNQAVCALFNRPKYEFFNYCTLRSMTSELESKAVGSAQQNISKAIVESALVILPSQAIVELFHDTVKPWIENWIACLHEIELLERTRDHLLPRLLGGDQMEIES